jgi:hypothetical protein
MMSQRRVGDVFASVGAVLAIAGPFLLIAEYFLWLKTDVWRPIRVRTMFDAMNVSAPQALDAVLKLPLCVAMFMVGLVFIWMAAEFYDRHARSLRDETNL